MTYVTVKCPKVIANGNDYQKVCMGEVLITHDKLNSKITGKDGKITVQLKT